MRAETVKRLAILIAVLSLIGGTGFFVRRFQVEKMGQSVLDEADRAEKAGKFTDAERLYGEHVQVFPDDVDAELKRVDAILKADNSPSRQHDALEIYSAIVTRHSGHEDARRRLMELKVDRGQFISSPQGTEGADVDLKVLLDIEKNKDDGHLLFLQGRCNEAAEKYNEAAENYAQAVKYKAPEHKAPDYKAPDYKVPEWIEASQRRANLLRDQLKEPEQADQAIETMVHSDPENDEVYLARGRYRLAGAKGDGRKALLAGARVDFEKALRLDPRKPETYLLLAKVAEQESGPDAAQRLLEDGVKKLPSSIPLYLALAEHEFNNRRPAEAIKRLEAGLKEVAAKEAALRQGGAKDAALTSIAGAASLHRMLAGILAAQGKTDKLRLEIETLERMGHSYTDLQYLKACYYFNADDVLRARQNLLPLQAMKGLPPGVKVRINMLLAQCYHRLGDTEMEENANRLVLRADPENINAKLASIDYLVQQGAIETAIKECRTVVDRAPQVPLKLVSLLIARNQRQPESLRDWAEVKQMIEDAFKAAPESVNPIILEAELLLAQDRAEEARTMLENAGSRFP
jgi:tetratricopeptide (TPR) repeat protein